MDSISDFVRGGKAGCGVQVSGISSILADWRSSGTQLAKNSEILFGHIDNQGFNI
jgi:hypothetical protein